MSERINPFAGIVGGRLLTYFEEAFECSSKGNFRGAYDYGMLALNSTMFEQQPGRLSLFARLQVLIDGGRLDASVLAFARSSSFLNKHERGITDMDLSYMRPEELDEFFDFLRRFYRSLSDNGALVAHDPRGQ